MIVVSDPAKGAWILFYFWWTSLDQHRDFLPWVATLVACRGGIYTTLGSLLTYTGGTYGQSRCQLTLNTLPVSHVFWCWPHSYHVVGSPVYEDLPKDNQNTSAFWSPSNVCCWKLKQREILFQIEGLPYFLHMNFLLFWCYECSISWAAS